MGVCFIVLEAAASDPLGQRAAGEAEGAAASKWGRHPACHGFEMRFAGWKPTPRLPGRRWKDSSNVPVGFMSKVRMPSALASTSGAGGSGSGPESIQR